MPIRVQQGLFEEPPPEPLRGHGVIHIGTSGYSFPDWEGVFYPPKLPKKEWLAYYSGQFSAAEINATYYRLPPATTFETMARKTPEGYPFWVKLPGGVTHGSESLETLMSAFFESVAPLHETGRLAGCLAQFPPSFRPCADTFDKLRKLRDLSKDIRLAVELRRDDWQSVVTGDFLRREGLVHVVADLPRLPGLPSCEPLVVNEVAYFRLHGRNVATWFDSTKGDRYDYDYSLDELRGFLPLIEVLDEKALQTFVFFNNCHMGQAVKNARMLRELLRGELSIV